MRIYPLAPRNDEQADALEALRNPDIHLVALSGIAGTGKSLLALGAGLEQASGGVYEKVIVSRPIVPMGNDLGHLPGTLEEKLAPWTQPILDAAEVVLRQNPRHLRNGVNVNALVTEGLLEVEALTFIRGRSIPDHYFIVDEAQNLSPHEIKTIITRAGEGTKIVLTGDPDQIDRPELVRKGNGLTYVIERFQGQELFASFKLEECVRSPLAALGAKLL